MRVAEHNGVLGYSVLRLPPSPPTTLAMLQCRMVQCFFSLFLSPIHYPPSFPCVHSVPTTAGDKEELLDLPPTTPQESSVSGTPQMSRRQKLSDRIHELNKGLEEEQQQELGHAFETDGEGKWGYSASEQQQVNRHYYQHHEYEDQVQKKMNRQPHHNKPNRIVFHEEDSCSTTQFAHLATDRAMGFRIAPPRNSISDDDEEDEEGETGDVEDEDDYYFDENYDDCDVDESTTLRKPSSSSGNHHQVKKIVNR